MTQQGTVLYVDDDEDNRFAFASLFRQAGFAVEEAATGTEALQLVKSRPDLVILDVNLPDINGFEVCRRIKMHPATTPIPVMHLSGVQVTPEVRSHALDEGADVYLTKPVAPEELLAQAKALMRIHQAEERERAAALQWQATFDAINDGVCLLDAGGRVVRCNRALARILRRASGKIIGATADELTPSPAGAGASTFLRMLGTRRRETADLPLGDRWLQAVADPMLGAGGALTGAVYVLTDVTERKRLEEQVRQKQKMEAMGQLAGGISHDFGNLLTAITGNLSLLLATKTEQDPDRELLQAVERAAWRGAELTRQLLGFSRQTTPQFVPTDLRACLDEVAGLLRRTIGRQITMEVQSAPDLWPAQANAGQIHQVLLNLCLNAKDAMPQGGRLVLRAENVALDEAEAGLHAGGRAGEFVRLQVRDTGGGIPEGILPHIFEPFFTTKGADRGTGLGLAVALGIVQQHQGWIECQSAVSEGTCFNIYLPRTGADSAPRGAEPAPPEQRSGPGAPQGTPEPGPAAAGRGSAGEGVDGAAAGEQGGSTATPPQPDPIHSADPAGRKEGDPDSESFRRSGLTKAEAENLLDWLEASGIRPQDPLTYEEGSGYTVSWRQARRRGRYVRCRRRHHRQSCPSCGSTSRPYMKREMTTLSWVLVAVGVLLWPLLVAGFLLRAEVWRCWTCNRVLGRGRKVTLGW